MTEPLNTSVDPDADGLVGGVTAWPSNVLPSTKYRWCEGDLLSRTEFSLLFSRLGELHGAGDGSTTFALPNYKKRFLVGLDSADSGYDTVGETGGSASGAVSGTTGAAGGHSHGAGTYGVTTDAVASSGGAVAGFAASGTQAVTGTSGSVANHDHTFSGTAATIPPYNVVRYIIKIA